MPILTVIAGPNGSGKSTLTNMLVQQGVSFGDYLNADDIANTLVGSPSEVSARAQMIVREKRDLALAEGRDHAFETVMSHPSHIDYMAKAASHGFSVKLYFVATEDPELNIDRVANRVLHGGHDVPVERIVNRYYRCLSNLKDAIKAAEYSEIFDNSSVDRPLRWLASIYNPRSSHIPDAALSKMQLFHIHVARSVRNQRVDPSDIPVWWLEILMQIKSDDPFADGSTI